MEFNSDFLDFPLPDEVRRAVDEIMEEEKIREELLRIGILESMKRGGGEISLESERVKEGERYQKALDMTLDLVRESLCEELVALYLEGSFLRGDFILGWSDIDITTIVKDEVWMDESLKSEFFEKCKAISKEVEDATGIYVTLGFRLATTYESVIRKKVNLALFLARKGRLIHGKDIFQEAPDVDHRRIPEWGRAATIWICDYLSGLLQEEKPKERSLIQSAKEAVTYVMKIAQNCLFMRGIVKLQKKAIVDTFEKEYGSLVSKEVVREAHSLQLSWKHVLEGKVKPQNLEDFIERAKVFVRDIETLAQGQR